MGRRTVPTLPKFRAASGVHSGNAVQAAAGEFMVGGSPPTPPLIRAIGSIHPNSHMILTYYDEVLQKTAEYWTGKGAG